MVSVQGLCNGTHRTCVQASLIQVHQMSGLPDRARTCGTSHFNPRLPTILCEILQPHATCVESLAPPRETCGTFKMRCPVLSGPFPEHLFIKSSNDLLWRSIISPSRNSWSQTLECPAKKLSFRTERNVRPLSDWTVQMDQLLSVAGGSKIYSLELILKHGRCETSSEGNRKKTARSSRNRRNRLSQTNLQVRLKSNMAQQIGNQLHNLVHPLDRRALKPWNPWVNDRLMKIDATINEWSSDSLKKKHAQWHTCKAMRGNCNSNWVSQQFRLFSEFFFAELFQYVWNSSPLSGCANSCRLWT